MGSRLHERIKDCKSKSTGPCNSASVVSTVALCVVLSEVLLQFLHPIAAFKSWPRSQMPAAGTAVHIRLKQSLCPPSSAALSWPCHPCYSAPTGVHLSLLSRRCPASLAPRRRHHPRHLRNTLEACHLRPALIHRACLHATAAAQRAGGIEAEARAGKSRVVLRGECASKCACALEALAQQGLVGMPYLLHCCGKHTSIL